MKIGIGRKDGVPREDTAKWNKKLLTTFMHWFAELYASNEREDLQSQELKPVQVISSNMKATLSAPLAEEQSDFKIGQVCSLDPLGHSGLSMISQSRHILPILPG